MKNKHLKYFIPVLVIIVFLTGFALGRLSEDLPSEKNLTNTELGQPAALDFSVFWDAWNLVEAKFVERGNLNRQKMVFGAVRGLINSLGDPYSTFFTPDEYENFADELQGSFEGIGAEIGVRDGILTVISPLAGTPAQNAGLEAGDMVLEVNGESTSDLSLDEAVSKIKGPRGTEVSLTVLKKDEKETREIKIVRDKIEIPVLESEIVDNYAVIKIFDFTENIDEEFKKAAVRIIQSDVEGVILDLRNNPGGYLERGVDIAGWFLENNQVVVSEDYGQDNKTVHRSAGPSKLLNYPLVVLINEGSASASEILAGALKDQDKAVLVGKKSFGKGSIQELEQLRDGASIKLTIAKWLTPLGHSIDGEGIKPDFEVDYSLADFEQGKDPQKEKAVEVLKKIINEKKGN